MDLFSKRLLMVTGKGGVGKTTISLALGLIAAEQGKKVLIAEVYSEEAVSHFLERPAIGHQEVEFLPRLYGINVNPRKSFEEYILLQIKFRSLYKAVFENKLVRYFIDATPGLADLMCIGKIYSLVDSYDLVIVDAPATGHGIALLEIASVVSSAVRVGPLNTEAKKINDLLHDPQKTQIVLVTLPEEMPVTEALEMKAHLSKMSLSIGAFILNQYQENPFSASEMRELEKHPLRPKLELLLARSRLSEHYRQELMDENPLTVPLIASAGFGLSEIEAVASCLEGEGLR